MIYTLTLNPALDKMLTFKEINRKDVNRPLKKEYIPGGKGINVSRAVSKLGVKNRALFFSGGENGLKIERLLENEGVESVVVRIEEETRENVKLYGEDSKEEIRINESGAPITKESLIKLEEILKKIDENSYVVMSGTIPEGVEDDFYLKTAAMLKRDKSAKIIIDADLDVMKKALEAQPFMIKPNTEELKRLLGENAGVKEFVEMAEKHAIEYAFLTDGKNGAYLYHEKRLYSVKSPKVNAVTTLGAGDSFIGGFISALSKKETLINSLKTATATAAAKVEDNFNIMRIKELMEEVNIEEIKITEEV
jgi:1-phosphofructokinase family hexose kinase